MRVVEGDFSELVPMEVVEMVAAVGERLQMEHCLLAAPIAVAVAAVEVAIPLLERELQVAPVEVLVDAVRTELQGQMQRVRRFLEWEVVEVQVAPEEVVAVVEVAACICRQVLLEAMEGQGGSELEVAALRVALLLIQQGVADRV